MGLSDFPPVIFYSEAFGEEVTLIERDIQGFQMAVEEVWPQAKRCSHALQLLETTAIELRMDPKPCSVVIDVGTDRALMAVFAAGKLIWSIILDEEYREKMIEAAAEASEDLLNKYLEDGQLDNNDIIQGLRIRTIN